VSTAIYNGIEARAEEGVNRTVKNLNNWFSENNPYAWTELEEPGEGA
jgi:hypothetical protein